MSVLSARFSANLNVSIDNALTLFTPNDALNQVISQTFTNGTSDNQANKLYADQLTTTGGGYNLDLYSFGGAKDALGRTYALQGVRLLIIQSFSDNNIIVSINAGLGNAWTTLFNGTTDDQFKISARGTLILLAPTNVGYPVNSGMNTINIADAFSGSTTFNVIVVGYQ
jgi:hypothetical protein